MKVSLFLVLSFFLSTAYSFSENKEKSMSGFSSGYEEFMSYFPDMVSGENANKEKQLLPLIQINPDFSIGTIPDEIIEEDEYYEYYTFYAIGKILDYKGMDVFLIEENSERVDEDGYDNHVDSYSYLMFFKNGQPIGSGTITFTSRYYGEGGTYDLNSFFQPDLTISSHFYQEEQESATGYITPIGRDLKYIWQITPEAGREFVETESIRFSSPFFDMNYLDKNEDYLLAWDIRGYPGKDSKWIFQTDSYDGHMELYSTDIRILFYCEYRENHLKTIFETQDKNEQLIDTFIVGESKKETYLRTNIVIDTKWPVIETSDGELIVTPDGQFIYVDTTP